ncbi:O-antigen ligase like membrane protein [Arthrobacter sp. 49Tsu3.1M3]|uniref:O-antigen ligase family protein n=1 Tax=Arthrobacter sp. 49Tsu3.1M3 TaxID=1279029 RepID=UPI0009A5A82B|nr:O-antigen ligase family protein [Arthrobacter sp. 49Tsu3.1M3]SKB61559.1 O-antigen ligase like membrane protein [Arthrobacter sp. 49Tsu3.1M3]
MQLAAWAGVCLAAAFLFRQRARVPLAAVLGLWLLVPAIGSATLTGVSSGPLSVHPATWLVLSIFLVRLFHDPASIRMVVGRHFLLFLVLVLVIGAAFLATSTSGNGGGMVLLVDQIVVPVLFFLLLLAEAVRGGGLVQMLRSVLLALVALACAVAVAQWLTGSVLFYESGFKTQYWFARDSGRWMGTLDQPLALSLVVSVAAPLVAGLTRQWLQAGLLGLMAVAVLISQSRVGLVALAVATIVVVLFTRRPVWVKAAMLLVMTGVGTAIMTSPLVAGVAARVADDTGSSEARGLALEYFLSRWNEYTVAGQGIGSSYRVAVQAGLQTSFENPILMYGIDFGLLFAVLYFGAMAVLVFRGMRSGYPGLTLAGIMALVIPQTYSSLATRSAGGIVIWTVLAMVVIAADEARRGDSAPAKAPAQAFAAKQAAAKAAAPAKAPAAPANVPGRGSP